MTLAVACLGAGYFSQFHIDSWQRMPRAALVGVCDQDLSKAQATGAAAFDDLSEMLAETQPDILDIILPPIGHAAAIAAGIAAGVSAIICQKPFCTSLDEACAMAERAAGAGIPLIIHENFRFQPWYRTIKQALDTGRIGTVQRATFRLRPGDGQGDDAYLARQPYFQQMSRFLIHETGVHWIDTFRYLLGEPTHVYADLQRLNPVIAGEDAGLVIFDHPGGVRAVFDGNRHLDHAADNTRRTMGEAWFEGTGGTLTLTGDGAVQIRGFGESDSSQLLPPDAHDGFGGDCTHALQSHVVCGLLDGAILQNLATDYLRVIEIEEAIYRAAALGQKLDI